MGKLPLRGQVLGLFALALVVLRRYTPRLFLAYRMTLGFMLYIGTEIPLLGHAFLTRAQLLRWWGSWAS